MKVGDMVKHKWGTLSGHGLILEYTFIVNGLPSRIDVMWNCHGHITVHNLSTDFLEVINGS